MFSMESRLAFGSLRGQLEEILGDPKARVEPTMVGLGCAICDCLSMMAHDTRSKGRLADIPVDRETISDPLRIRVENLNRCFQIRRKNL